ncbi:MAG: DedA family protein [Idiomarina sp.]|nr:DedA family protein [Idiomarina sp.]
MKIFERLYEKALVWSRHPQSPRILSGVSFAESVIFPIPVDVMLAPMVLSQPHRWIYFAWLATFFSVLGGIAGYWLGYFAYEPLVIPMLEKFNYVGHFESAQQWFSEWGVWVVFLAGFSPIPYKVFTVTAGVMMLAFWPFVIASLIGRAMRFFLVAWLMRIGGPLMERHLKKHFDTIGWSVVVLALLAYFYFR